MAFLGALAEEAYLGASVAYIELDALVACLDAFEEQVYLDASVEVAYDPVEGAYVVACGFEQGACTCWLCEACMA